MLLGTCLALATGSDAASTSTVVSMDVPSAITLTNSCTTASARSIGVVLPGGLGTTETGVGACRVAFGSSNDSSRLSIRQSDAVGTAMGLLPGATTPWSRTVPTSTNAIRSISMVNSDEGWAATASNVLLHKTLAGGNAWNSVTTGYSEIFVDVHAVSSTLAFAVGSGGMVARWDGTSWSRIDAAPIPSTVNMTAVTATSSSNVWVATIAGTIFHWNGSSWSDATPTGNTTRLNDIASFDANKLYAVGANGRIFRTTTGGATPGAWTAMAAPTSQWLWQVTIAPFGTGDTIWTSSTSVHRSQDGGATWDTGVLYPNITGQSVLGLSVSRAATSLSTAVVWAGNTIGELRRSSDGGASWGSDVAVGANSVRTLYTVSDSVAVAGGTGRQIQATADGSTWSYHATPSFVGDPLAVSAVSRDVAYVAGADGLLLKTTDGSTWASPCAPACPIPNHLRDIDALTATDVIAVGDGPVARRSTDGGATWTSMTVPAGAGGINAVSYPDRSAAWAVGRGGTILRWDGASWKDVNTTGLTMDFLAVSAVSDRVAYVGGNNGRVLHTGDGGATWTVRTLASEPVAGIATSTDDPTRAIAVRVFATYVTSDSGATWSLLPQSVNNNKRGLSRVSSDVTWMSGENGTVARTIDGDAGTWTTLGSSASSDWTYDIDALDANTAYAVAANGLILRMTSPAAVADYGAAGATWGATDGGLFGACLQTVGGAAAAVTWTASAGTCDPNDATPWNAIPAAATSVAQNAAPGTGSVDLVFGFRAVPSQPPGTYTAGITFEAVAPAA